MLRALIIPPILCIGACETLPLDDARLDHAYPQHGLTQGPDGWYMTRQDGTWGTNARQSIWHLNAVSGVLEQLSWTAPEHSDSDFYYSARDARACFISTRPLPTSPERTDANIWCANWTGKAWTQPEPLPAPINSPAGEWSPVLTSTGTLYFASDREGGRGLGDLYRAAPDGMDWRVEPLSEAINSRGGEWNLDISPDGLRLVFEASHRDTNRTVPGDLYLSVWVDGNWMPAQPLKHLNTDGSDLMARFISPRRIIFTSVENGDAKFRQADIK